MPFSALHTGRCAGRAMSTGTIILQTQNLSARYGEAEALHSVDLAVGEGELVEIGRAHV